MYGNAEKCVQKTSSANWEKVPSGVFLYAIVSGMIGRKHINQFCRWLAVGKIINHLKAGNNAEHSFHKTKKESNIIWNTLNVQITSHSYSANIFENILKTNIEVRMSRWQRKKYIHDSVFGSTGKKQKCFRIQCYAPKFQKRLSKMNVAMLCGYFQK